MAYTDAGASDANFALDGVLRLSTTGSFNAIAHLSPGILVAVGGCGLAFCAYAFDQNGLPDPAFGAGGLVVTRFSTGSFFDMATTVAVNESSVMVVGKCDSGLLQTGWDFCAAKFDFSGTLVASFADQGKFRAAISVGGGFDYADAVVALSDGSQILIGTCQTDGLGHGEICAIKLTPAGVMSPTFAINGILSLRGPNVTTGTIARNAVLRSDGKVLIIGTCNGAYDNAIGDSRFCSVAISSEGVVDTGHGSDGWFKLAATSGWFDAHSSALQSDAKLLIAGQCVNDAVSVYDFCVARVNSNGILDSSFGLAGLMKIPFENAIYEAALSVHVDVAHRAILGGGCTVLGASRACFSRIHTRQDFFDLDSDNQSKANTDGVLYLRSLLGFDGAALTDGALGVYANRVSGAEISSYLSSPNSAHPVCNANIVGIPSGPIATIDGLILLRVMLGLSGDAVTNGTRFPVSAVRTSWPSIKAYLVDNCGMVLN